MRGIIAAFGIVVSAASAQALTGNEMHAYCSGTEIYKQIACSTYVRGFVEGVQVHQAVSEKQSLACFPEGLAIAQPIDVFKAFLRDNPGTRHMDASILLAQALREEWPCKN